MLMSLSMVMTDKEINIYEKFESQKINRTTNCLLILEISSNKKQNA